MSIRIGDEVWCMPRFEAVEVYPWGTLPPDGLMWYQKCVVATIADDTIGVDFGMENLAGQELHSLNGALDSHTGWYLSKGYLVHSCPEDIEFDESDEDISLIIG